MPDEVLIVERAAAGYAVVTLNRPRAMNALSLQLCKQLGQTLRELEADPAVRVLIVTGTGRAFCAGLDLKELGEGASALLSQLDPQDDPGRALQQFSGPVIGAINGAAITGGLEMALGCDVLIASTEARFADTHLRVGLMPTWGLSQKLSRTVGLGMAKEISFSGNFVSAERALAIGLVNRVVDAADLMAQARQLATDMLSAVPELLVAYKALIDDGFSMNLAQGLQLEQQRSHPWNRDVNSKDVEQRRAAVQQRGKTQARTNT